MIPNDPEIEASWATQPQFYRAPFREGGDDTPMEFQHAGVEYLIRRDHGLFGDEPGLGKSCESILLSNSIGAKHTLVVCPASLRLNWKREVLKWSTIDDVKTETITKGRNGASLLHDYTVVSYDLLRNRPLLEALLDGRWDHLILDEAHMLKDPKGNERTKAICGHTDKHGNEYRGLVDVVGRITLCSGTILPNAPIECYNPIRMTNWKAINYASLEEFREQYYDYGAGFVTISKIVNGQRVTEQKWSNRVRNVPRNMGDLQRRLRTHLMVRRLKKDVLPQLPAKQWHLVPIDSDSHIRAALNHPGWQMAEHLYDMNPHAFDTSMPIDGAISTARRMLGEAKAPHVAAFVNDLIASGVTKVVIGAWHKTVLDYLYQALRHHGLVYMDGSTSPAAKQDAVDRFQNDERVKIILGQMIPLGEGWTLTAAKDMVLAEPYWVPGKNDQLFDRINRIGQTSNYTLGHVLVVPGTMDERVLGSAILKDQHIFEALDKRS